MKKLNAVFFYRDCPEDVESHRGFIVYGGDDAFVRGIYEKIEDKIFGEQEKDIKEINKETAALIENEFKLARELLEKEHGYQVSEMKTQSNDRWLFDAFVENKTWEEFIKEKKAEKDGTTTWE